MLPQESTMDVNCLKFFKYQYSASLEAAREMGRRTRALGNLLYHAGRAGRVAVAVGGSFVTGQQSYGAKTLQFLSAVHSQ